MLLAVPFGLAIGLVVGMVGGGGAILALPVLVYVLGQDAGVASTGSLLVIALAAAVGAVPLARRGQVCWPLALAFTAPAVAGSPLGTMANAALGETVLLAAFAPVMLIAAGAVWRRAGAAGEEAEGSCPSPSYGPIVSSGFVVGALTGLLGVGGGFVVVPVLTLRLGVGFRRAVATSLVIIALTGIAALVGHLLAGVSLEAGVAIALAVPTAAGAVLGVALGRRLPQLALGRSFAVLVAVVAVLMVVDLIAFGGPPGR
jgi:hypothetical protein